MPEVVHHRDKTPLCDMTEYPAAGGCHVFFLTDRELWIAQSLLFPFAHWQTRYVYPISGELYRIVSDQEFLEINDVVESLEVSLWGGINMDCSELLGIGNALAEAIKAIRCTTNVSCGAGGAGPPGYVPTLAGTLSPLGPDDFNGPPGITEPDPEGDPPEGFESWQAYEDHKCRAAHYVFGIVRAAAVACQALSGFQLLATIVAPVAAGLAGLLPVVFTPAGFVIFVGAIVTVGTLHILAFSEMSQMISRLDARKEDIICALYTSGDAATAMDILADAIEDAIEFIVFSGVLGPLSAAIKSALGLAFTQFVNTNVVNVLFRLVEDFTFPEADCSFCEEPILYVWHFDNNEEGWVFVDDTPAGVDATYQWLSSPDPVDPLDSSPGCLEMTLHSPGSIPTWSNAQWKYSYPAGSRPVAQEGTKLQVDIRQSPVQAPGKFRVQIWYDDGNYDNLVALGGGWGNVSLSSHSAYYGKSITHITVGGQYEGNSSTFFTWWFDRARLEGYA